MDCQTHAAVMQQRDGALIGVQSLHLGMGFILNDTDVLVYGRCEDFLFFAVTDYNEACELLALDNFSD